jgi:hypothetical protein
MILRERFLRDQRMRLAVSQITWGRANQLRDFVRVLELRAIDLNDRARISKQDLGCRFHNARLPRPCRPQE